MKRNQHILSKVFVLFFLFNNLYINSQTILSSGDAVFTLMNLEGADFDAFGFVLLTDVEAGTQISVTDAEYVSGTGFAPDDEGRLAITFVNGFSCGTEVIIRDIDPASPIYTFGTDTPGITIISTGTNDLSLTTAGETLIMFQGDNLNNPCSTCFVSALANTGVGFGETATGSSELPPGLILGQSAMVMTARPNGDEWDNIKYNCNLTQELPAVLRATIYDPANWLSDNDVAYPTEACSPAFGCSPCPSPAFTLSNSSYCISAGIQTNLGGGTPVGGSYSGPGVTDNGNGMTFSFDPANAGVGSSMITYTLTGSCPSTTQAAIEVSAGTNTTFTSLATIDFNEFAPGTAPVNLGNVTPSGGSFSSSSTNLVIDDGNGMSFSINPNFFAVGTYEITYSYTNSSGCTEQSSQNLQVIATPTTFSMPSNICIDEAVQNSQTGGLPNGGTYSGPGVTDDGNGMTFSFNPSNAGVGIHSLSYTRPSGAMASSAITVYALPTVELENSIATVDINASLQTVLSGGTPTGGIYSGPGVSDNSNGMTYSFDPSVAGIGTHIITYNFSDTNGCENSATDMINVEMATPLAGETCTTSNDINGLFGQTPNEVQISSTWNNTNYTTDASDPTNGYECFFEMDGLAHTIWYSFTGDGNRYLIRSAVCDGSTPNLDTQVAIYSGDCSNLTAVVCNEDEDGANAIFNFNTELLTEVGVSYLMMVDAYQNTTGTFCLEVTNLTTVNVIDIDQTDIKVFPNPTKGLINFDNTNADRIEILDNTGRVLIAQYKPNRSVDISSLAPGVYFFRLYEDRNIITGRVLRI